MYYVLCKRLKNREVTALQRDAEWFYLFSERGVTLIDSKTEYGDVPGVSKGTWALVNSNESVTRPAGCFVDADSPFFIVEAASPRPYRWGNRFKGKGVIKMFYMKPFTFQELLCA